MKTPKDMKQSAVLFFCCSVFLTSIFNSCTKDDLDDFEGTAGTFTDNRDNTEYVWLRIGDQIWMGENLAYLPTISPSAEGSETDPYYYVYNYQGSSVSEAKASDNFSTYGVLYNWPAAMASCPDGWHLPDDAEWEELENYLADNGYNYDGTTGGGRAKIGKSMGSTSAWTSSSNTGSPGNTDYPEYRNKSGFTALPGGARITTGIFYHTGNYGLWWSTTTDGIIGHPWSRVISYDLVDVYRGTHYKLNGFSVRCVRD